MSDETKLDNVSTPGGELPPPLRRAEWYLLSVLTVLLGLFHWWARAASVWDWDEALFCLALRDYDVSFHHPHPPGFPVFVALAKLLVVGGAGEFQALQFISFVGSVAVLPLAFFAAREMGFRFQTSVAGALLLSVMPNVTLYGGSAFSDVSSLALSLAAITLLLRGRNDRAAYIWGSALLALAIGIRVQNLLLGLGPGLMATVPRLRRQWKDVVIAAVIGVTIVAICYGAAAAATGSMEAYRTTVEKHADYVSKVDSWRNPERPPLGVMWEDTVVRPWRGGNLPGIIAALALLAIIDLAVNRYKPAGIVLLTFAPFMLFAWLMLDWLSMTRLSIGFIALHALLAARGIEITGSMISSWLRSPVGVNAGILTLAAAIGLLGKTIPAVEVVRSTKSPAVEAFEWIAKTYDPAKTRLFTIEGSTNAFADLVAPAFHDTAVRDDEEIPLDRDGRDSIFICERDRYGATKTFSRSTKKLKGLVRDRYFLLSVVPMEHTVVYLDGWYDPEGETRWMGKKAEIAIAASGRPRQLDLVLETPSEFAGTANVTFMQNGVVRETIRPATAVFKYSIPLPASDPANRITIAIDKSVRPSEVDPSSKDDRDLGLRILELQLREADTTTNASPAN